MKRSLLLPGLVLLFSLLVWFFPMACGTNNSPTVPPPPAPTSTPCTDGSGHTCTPTPTLTLTGTPTFTPTPTPTVLFNWENVVWFADIPGPSVNSVYFLLQVDGQPMTTAGITVAGGGVTLNVPLHSPPTVTYGSDICAYYQLNNVTFVPGANYAFSTSAYGQTASVTMTAPGSFAPVTDIATPWNGAITFLSWGGSFNEGYVKLQETGPATGPVHAFYFSTSPDSVALPTGTAVSVIGYSASAPSTYSLIAETDNYSPAPAGSKGGVAMEIYLSESLTLR